MLYSSCSVIPTKHPIAGPYLEVGQGGGGGDVALTRFEEKYKLPLKDVV